MFRLLAVLVTLLAVPAASAQAEPARFAGLALGDTRETVEAVLAQAGHRCMSDGERAGFAFLNARFWEDLMRADACRIVADGIDLTPDGTPLEAYFDEVVVLEYALRGWFFAAVFEDERAVRLALAPSFLGADPTAAPAEAASAIAEILQLGPLTPMGAGFSARGPGGEIVRLPVSADGRLLTVDIQPGPAGR